MSPLLPLLVCALAAAAARAAPEDCGLPKERGTCGQFAVRYYYDTEYGGCLRFWYGGCDGNGNRFSTEPECERTCVTSAGDDLCRLPAVRGACKRSKTRWYSDPASGGCRQFTYSGCLGNDNRFESESACQQRCGRVTPDSGSGGSGGGISGGVPTTTAAPGPADCLLPDRVAGDCSQYVIRYSYMAARRQCAPFYYGGCGGNGNRFDTAEACQAACVEPPTTRRPYYVPPRQRAPSAPRQPDVWGGRDTRPDYRRGEQPPYGREERPPYGREEERPSYGREEERPSYGREERPQPTEPSRQPEPETPDTSAPAGDICSLPSDTGNCRAYIPSYYFNAVFQRCVDFIYGGCGGNENRFTTLNECEERCGRKQARPAPTPVPREPEPETLDTPAPTVDICSLPSVAGRCKAYLPSYYFNAVFQRCVGFIYGGCGGNENRFTTLDECEERCGRGEDRSPSTPAPREPEPETPDTSAPTDDICSLPSDTGDCRAYNPSYYFNAGLKRCVSFIYGGCGGNENRFTTLDECEERCGRGEDRSPSTPAPRRLFQPETEAPNVPFEPDTQAPPEPEPETPDTPAPTVDICSLPSVPGRCRAYLPSYYFNAGLQRCVRFIYGGCGGNENRFSTLTDCQERCGGAREPEVQPTEAAPPTPPPETESPETEVPDAYITLPTAAAPNVCQLAPTAGPCGQRLQRYYFNAPLATCFTFTYSGCGGNDNRFESAAECRARCQPGEPEVTFAPYDLDYGAGGAGAGAETTTLADYPNYDYDDDYPGLTGDGGGDIGIDTSAPMPPGYYDEYYVGNYDDVEYQ